ncbi:plastid replication-repair enzyme, putative [Plasmodium knowlesi strain H]|uniref:Plastid replication-repair enzyme, putative n=3 Tax=Plasmodium knowlesi TaxID=5850 RepID=A0A5K1TVK7_PLAKH|nr:POM1-like protein [Plasmodium knowlesi strain H]OTN67632.1 putative POM1-like protein [Plasmodium knowlesi]CAA9990494.1 plastid replication-repair enzyme, putative [Plasmodium knowlesi strain H]SBO19721.1 plastid replication-repair enzyme, putative [Plasmodium knowlesi strain H]SBO22469.1 plastid replication-repair enzyme, putative [Plasmodium knowlesi strain H]VVS79968.1 plastid replication-repair enzyme, putative [Plasmodium knowlesi strain H]|eukprot:XP_002260883.1 POM1-like protein [Plasmodium knowlesi strain H]
MVRCQLFLFYLILIHYVLAVRNKSRPKADFYLKTNCELVKRRKNGSKAYFKRKVRDEDLGLRSFYDQLRGGRSNCSSAGNHDNHVDRRNSGALRATSTFVSKYYKININDVYSYLNRKKYEYIETDVKITLKYCPFCPPHKYKYDNMYKHEIFKNTGNSYCHRCGYKGSFYDFKLKMGDLVTSNFESTVVNNTTYEEEKITFNDVKVYNMNLLYSKEAEGARKYLVEERKLNLETLKKYYIGFSIMEFQSLENSGKFEKHECLIFPFIKKANDMNSIGLNGNRNNTNEKDSYEIVRIKVRSLRDKGYMRLYPKNVKDEMKLFFFGDHLVSNSEEIVLTEGEIDAMTVNQETNYAAISLPNGSKSLPIYLLPYLERFKKIHLWLDFDKAGKSSVFNFVNKIGLGRTNVINDTNVQYLDEQVFERKRKNMLTKGGLLLPLMIGDNAIGVAEQKQDAIKENTQSGEKNGNTECIAGGNEPNTAVDPISGTKKSDLQITEKAKSEGDGKNNSICGDTGNKQEEAQKKVNEESKVRAFHFVQNNIMYIPNNIVVKDANDCLRHNIDIRFFIENSEKVKHSQILNFNDLRQNILEELKYPDRINGIKSKTIPSLNKFLYGLRMGELSIWTGPTGVGKTTLLSQLSLDYCIQGVSTLWGSFEINNIKLGKVMLNQFCGKNLEKNIELFDLYADKFELLPLKFLKFHGSTNIDQVLDAMDYAVYAYDVKHIIIDNLQFMLNINKFSDIYELQNIAIDKFRSFSTNKNVHITLVVHPRKEDNNLLSIASVFGSVKSTQEADNVFIIQRQVSKTNETVFFIDIKKNRFKGCLGRIPYLYNKENMTIKEMSIGYLNDAIPSSGYGTKVTTPPSNFVPNVGPLRGGLDFTLCDEYDYMKQLSEEYESKHAMRKYRVGADGRVSGVGSASTNNPNASSSVHRAPNECRNDSGATDSLRNNQNNDNKSVNQVGDAEDDPTSNNRVVNTNDKSEEGRIKKNMLKGDDQGRTTTPVGKTTKSDKPSGDIIHVQNSPNTKREKQEAAPDVPKQNVSSYRLSSEGITKLCEEIKDNKNEMLKDREITISMRNCVINKDSTIKDIRNFIKTNKLNIKTAGKNLKKVDVFIAILQSIPKEYITIKYGGGDVEKDNPDKNSVGNRTGENVKRTKVHSTLAENHNGVITGGNPSGALPVGGPTKNNFNIVSSVKESSASGHNIGHSLRGYVSHPGKEDALSGEKQYSEEIKSIYGEEVTKRYIQDNIINVDDNIVKRSGMFKLEGDNKMVSNEKLEYYEPVKKFDDDIESRFFLINDNNYNEKINNIYKNVTHCGLDIETTGLEVFDEKIRLIQIAVENYPVIIYDMFNITKESILTGLREILKNEKVVKIIQNGKFDAKFLMHNNFQVDNIFDTYIASKLLDKNKNMYGFKLNNIVEKYLNVTLDKQQQNSVWNNSLLNNNQLFYAARDSSCLLKLYKKLKSEICKENMETVNDIENKCILPICDMELNGITVDLESLKKSTNEILSELNTETSKLKAELKDEEININSQQQVLKALQNNNVRDISNKLIENTSDSNLKNFLNHKEVVLLRNYRRLYKLYSAFYLKLPQHINKKTNKIHTTFNQLKTFSGRFSSEKPNLQQIPRQKNIREIFIPQKDNIFIIADFKQIELKIAAEITNDDIMLKAYNNNIDLHTLTASIITKKPIADVNKEDRHIAKAINFGLIYGMNYVNLKNYANTYYNLNMNLDQCLYFYNSFFEHYKGIYRWHNQIKQIRGLEYSTLSNRKVIFPYFSFTKALNYPVQGTCADILKLSLVELYKNLKPIHGKIILCVHDEIIIEVDKKYQEDALKILVESMENSASFFLKKVKCEVSVKIAQNWGSKE